MSLCEPKRCTNGGADTMSLIMRQRIYFDHINVELTCGDFRKRPVFITKVY